MTAKKRLSNQISNYFFGEFLRSFGNKKSENDTNLRMAVGIGRKSEGDGRREGEGAKLRLRRGRDEGVYKTEKGS